MAKTCSVDGCDEKHKGHGYCSKHLYRAYRNGTLTKKPVKHKGNLLVDKGLHCEIEVYNKRNVPSDTVIISTCDIDKISDYRVGVSKGYATICIGEKKYLLHRYLLDIHLKEWDEVEVDHINRNPLDNRRENLRFCNSSENKCNKGARRDSMSGIKNIRYREEKRLKYQAYVGKDGKYVRKSFSTLDEAIEWRDSKLLELHGDFARRGNNG